MNYLLYVIVLTYSRLYRSMIDSSYTITKLNHVNLYKYCVYIIIIICCNTVSPPVHTLYNAILYYILIKI